MDDADANVAAVSNSGGNSDTESDAESDALSYITNPGPIETVEPEEPAPYANTDPSGAPSGVDGDGGGTDPSLAVSVARATTALPGPTPGEEAVASIITPPLSSLDNPRNSMAATAGAQPSSRSSDRLTRKRTRTRTAIPDDQECYECTEVVDASAVDVLLCMGPGCTSVVRYQPVIIVQSPNNAADAPPLPWTSQEA